MATITIDGKAMPEPLRDGVSVVDNKTWSENAGRTSSGKFVGTIKAVKRTVTITWGRLSFVEAKKIRDVTKSATPFHTMVFHRPDGVGTESMTCYFDNPQFVIRRVGESGFVQGVTLTAIEQ